MLYNIIKQRLYIFSITLNSRNLFYDGLVENHSSFHYTFIIIYLRDKLILETSKLFSCRAFFWHCRACCYHKPTHLPFYLFLSFYPTSAALEWIILVSRADRVSNEPRIQFIVRNSLGKQ